MNKHDLEILIEQQYSQRDIARKLSCSQSSVRYWLRVYDLKTKKGPKGKLPKDYVRDRHCSCGETNPDNFYGNKTRVCASCHNKSVREIEVRNKNLVKDILGSSCSVCGYNRCFAAIDIHHTDSTKKDPNFKSWRCWSQKRLTRELEVCVLLCKNCHAEHHS